MSDQNSHDISHVQVPDSFIQEVLNETQPLKEAREEVHSSQAPQQAVREESSAEEGGIVKLLTLMFEEFDKLNSRLDSLQESLTEMTAAGGLGVGPGGGGCPTEKTSHKRRSSKAAPKKVRTESTDALTALLAKRLGR
tara:strand:- start:225 stop:638 length:414 start_codon:yes stop_codon:yes gene_type:complete